MHCTYLAVHASIAIAAHAELYVVLPVVDGVRLTALAAIKGERSRAREPERKRRTTRPNLDESAEHRDTKYLGWTKSHVDSLRMCGLHTNRRNRAQCRPTRQVWPPRCSPSRSSSRMTQCRWPAPCSAALRRRRCFRGGKSSHAHLLEAQDMSASWSRCQRAIDRACCM